MRLSYLLVALSWATGVAYAQFTDALRMIMRKDSSMVLPPTRTPDTLRLDRYLSMVQRYHPELRIAAATVERAQGAELSAWGALDPRLNGVLGTKHDNGQYKNNEFSASLAIPLYWGQRITLGFRRATDFFDRDILTTQEGEPNIGVSIPLLRNVQTDPVRTAIARAEQGVFAANAAFVERRNLLSFSALSDYFNWAAAHARYTVAAQLYEVARIRYEWIKAEIQRGERAPIDSIEILQEVFRRRTLLARARNQVERASFAITLNIWTSEFLSPLAIGNYIPEQFPPQQFLDAVQIDFDRVRARKQRPELQRLRAEYEQVSYDLRLVGESYKPLVNATVGLFSNGWNSMAIRQPSGYWKAGLTFELPLLYRAPIGQEQSIRAQQEQIRALIELQERRIDTDVLVAAATVNATYEQVILARSERIAAEIMVQAEQRLFERGESDLLRLNLRERLLGEAQEREIDALLAHAVAQALYRWAVADY
ncbi:MAG: TolC family protein [Bacteroidota bacterium]|nr:TolC family protein [Candidatus Kapabacteria bacterium]MCS7302629.1 TolC family protein [Candidatus Kapabacteria bacterium]MCX7936256.1 TolC family protein [Chlorobiota bacterium]MDW8074463.1 TolC family protein [Bacteroidota bacterium]MDW8271061.1 TolC family protein [Bacteroidota bacterium]